MAVPTLRVGIAILYQLRQLLKAAHPKLETLY